MFGRNLQDKHLTRKLEDAPRIPVGHPAIYKQLWTCTLQVEENKCEDLKYLGEFWLLFPVKMLKKEFVVFKDNIIKRFSTNMV